MDFKIPKLVELLLFMIDFDRRHSPQSARCMYVCLTKMLTKTDRSNVKHFILSLFVTQCKRLFWLRLTKVF